MTPARRTDPDTSQAAAQNVALPCPFCGAEASQWSTVDTEWVQCVMCYACSDVFDVNSGLALASWNQRVIL